MLAWCALGALAAPAQLCAGAAEDDPRAARFCQALNTFLELYAEAAGEQVPEYQGQFDGRCSLVNFIKVHLVVYAHVLRSCTHVHTHRKRTVSLRFQIIFQ